MRRTLSALILFAVAGTAGCSSGGSPQAAPSGPTAVAVWRDFVACARGNGQANFPDPVVDTNTGKATFPDFDSSGQKFNLDAVREQCGAILDRLPPEANPLADQPVTPERLQVMREYAQCLRENGLPDAPDPNPDGTWPEPVEPPGGWPADLGQRRGQAFAACDPIYEPRLRQ